MEYIQAKFSIGDLISKLLSSVSKIPSFMEGYDVSKTDANMDGNVIQCQRVLSSQKYPPLTITIGVDNFTDEQHVHDITAALEKASSEKTFDINDGNSDGALWDLCGWDYMDHLDDLSSSSAADGSLLNPKLTDKTTELPENWQRVANNLKYNIRCEAQGYSGGSVAGKTINEIIPKISTYLQLCGAVPQSEVAEFDINPVFLVLPLLIAIQDYLSKYLDSVNARVNDKAVQQDNSQQSDDQGDDQGSDQDADQGDDQGDDQTAPPPATAANTINIKLQNITATSDINLLGIQTDYTPGEALDVVDDILSNPDFTDLITETPQTYEVWIDDEGYDINPCDELIVHPEESLKQLFIQAIQFSRNLHMIHWLAIGNDMEKLHIKAEELYNELDEEIDLLAELIVEKTGTIIDINKIETWNTVGTQDRTFQQGIECIKQYAQSFIDYIDITYPNQPSDVQSILDDWLRYWNKQINYFIIREQE